MPDLTVWPTDGADGAVSSEARWRKMARLWIPSGVDASPLGLGAPTGLAPTLAAGPVINVAIGAAWLDGHYAELATPASIPATANGLLVVRFTPADNHAELLYRDAATLPTQTLATWELPIAQMTAGALTDKRVFADPQSAGVGYVDKLGTGNLTVTATSTVVPGSSALLGVGRWMVSAQFDVQVAAVDVATYLYASIGAWPTTATGIVVVSNITAVTRGINQGFARFAVPAAATLDVKTPTQIALFAFLVPSAAVAWTILGATTRWTAIRVGPGAP